MIKENFIKLYENSFRENWDLPCYTDYGEDTQYTYGEVAEKIARLHLLFKHCSLRRGDKISVIGKNNAHWCIAYMATITYGAIIVPILQDFTPNDVHHIVNHSESVFLFTSDSIWENLEEEKLTGLRGVFSLTDFRCLYQRDGETIQKFLKNTDKEMHALYPKGFTREDVQYTTLSNDKVMLLNYTSGTTGFSKGVMLTGNNLAGNVTFGIRTELLKKGDKVLSFLPLAHAYGCAFDFLTATAVGTHVTLLGKTPSPKIIMKAFEEVKPNLIITVPLVIEKIYKNIIQPLINKKGMKWALNIPLLDTQIYNQIRKRLIDALGGRFKEIIIGGAAMDKEVEEFFYKIKFPFTIGYGMTECGPLISYAPWDEFVLGSSGKILDIMEARIYKENQEAGTGEIQVRGENVMVGYYKNQEATQEVFTQDGWLRTGDLGSMDKIKFPFSIGYGMTECGPLISYAPWDEFVLGSSGKILDIMEARIYKETPEAETGEIQVRGENVMVGYYKNQEATQEVFTQDGWLRTGDLGSMDSNGNIFIRGRLKTMILSSSGQNIFPEELETKLNNLPFILESLVIERNKKLVALVYADYEALDSLGLNNPDNLKTIMDENLKNLNSNVAAYEKISKIQLYPTEFEKTPKRSIKRYLYNSIAVD